MSEIRLGLVEARFADIIWENEPITIKELIARCEKELNWKRTTTYTVLKKLCDRGIFVVEEHTITAQMSKDEFHSLQSEQFVDQTFHGSLPAFITAFTRQKKLTPEELNEIKAMMKALEEQQ